jgi:hypothetical protein
VNPMRELMLTAVAAGRVALADLNPRRAVAGRGVAVYDWAVDGRLASRRQVAALDDLAVNGLITGDAGPTTLTDVGRAALGTDTEEKASA